jgi:hypothetical protein
MFANIAQGGQGGKGGNNPDYNAGDGGYGGEGRGAGLATDGGLFLLVNNTFNANLAFGGDGGNGGDGNSWDHDGTGGNGNSGEGGAIYANDGALKLINDTIDHNAAFSGIRGFGGFPNGQDGAMELSESGGIFVDIGGARVDLVNTIVAQNLTNSSIPDIFGIIQSGDHDLIGNGTGAIFVTSNDDQVGGINNRPVIDPMLSLRGNYGGPTQTMIPLAGSPVIDTGDDAALAFIAAAENTQNSTDQRGYARLFGVHIDVGATEYGVGPTSPQPGDPVNGAPGTPIGTGAIPPRIPHGNLHLPAEALEASFRSVSSIFRDFLEDFLPATRAHGKVMLDQPVPLSPQGTIFTTLPTFTWTVPPSATHYLLIVQDLTTGQEVFAGVVPTNSWTPPMPLTIGDKYDWFVQARDDFGDFSHDSVAADFRVERLRVGPPRAFHP